MKILTPDEYTKLFCDPSAGCPGEPDIAVSGSEDFALPKRSPFTHKYSYGRALILAGSRGFSGAAAIAANACERSGAGLTTLMVPESIYIPCAVKCDGAVETPLPENTDGAVSEEAAGEILQKLDKADACAIGPGFGTGSGSESVLRQVLSASRCPLLLDADALTICGRDMSLIDSCSAPLVLTPHEGEFRRMGGDLSGGRLAGALSFTRLHPNMILVLKGHGTLICRGGSVSVNPTGSAAMAKGGSGDVLCGILCALLAQGFEPYYASCCAVYIHGLAGDAARERLGEYSVTPSDIISALPEAFIALSR